MASASRAGDELDAPLAIQTRTARTFVKGAVAGAAFVAWLAEIMCVKEEQGCSQVGGTEDKRAIRAVFYKSAL